MRPDRLAVGTLRRRAPVCGHGPGVSSYGRAMLLPRAAGTPRRPRAGRRRYSDDELAPKTAV
ncbi:hypothetical protein C6T66_29625 [Burkholderia multivorans]|nr:hypothetical protein C6T66_29625 [Burkholderia multivorans]